MTRYILVKAGRLIDGRARSVVKDGAVLVSESRIVAVGRASRVRAPHGTPVDELSYPDATLLPGFVDVHVHLNFGAHPSTMGRDEAEKHPDAWKAGGRTYEQVMREDSDKAMIIRGVRNCSAHLRAGVTTLRDCGSRNRTAIALRRATTRRPFASPRLLVSGPPMTVTDGHFWFCNGEASGIDGVRRQARVLLEAGVDFLKIMASGGGSQGTQPTRPTYTVEEIAVAVGEARARGKLTTAHCVATASIRNAVMAGIDQIEHVNFVEPDGSHRFDSAVAEEVVRRGVFVSPTIAAGYRRIEQLRAQPRLTGTDQLQLDSLQRRLDFKLEVVRRFRELGAKVVVGTDAIAAFGDYALDLELLVRAGFTPIEAIQAATRVAADAVGLGQVIGTLEAGKEADLLVVGGDPLTDVAATRRVLLVVRSGVPVAEPADSRGGR